MADYSHIPPTINAKLTPFTAHVSDEKLNHMLELIKLSPIGIPIYENQQQDRKWGLDHQWLSLAKEEWVTKFDWRKHEARINSYPNFTIPVIDDNDGHEYTIHFIALFSHKPDATPIVFYHGWPGSFLEFLDMLDVVRTKYPSPSELPYHIIVPSLPGYAFSSGPGLHTNWSMSDLCRVCSLFMHAVFSFSGSDSKGYVAQGGDLGSFIARQSAQNDPSCVGYHLNMSHMPPPADHTSLPVTELEKSAQPRGKSWEDTGTAYGQEHGTRTATIGLVLSASPIASLAWIAEKFLEWTDQDPEVEKVLESVSLYWLTDTMGRCIYPYRTVSYLFPFLFYHTLPFPFLRSLLCEKRKCTSIHDIFVCVSF